MMAVEGLTAAVVVWHGGEDDHVVARVRLTDGTRRGWLEVRVPAGIALPFSSAIEFAVEELAGTLPAENRLEALEELGPLVWTGTGLAGQA